MLCTGQRARAMRIANRLAQAPWHPAGQLCKAPSSTRCQQLWISYGPALPHVTVDLELEAAIGPRSPSEQLAATETQQELANAWCSCTDDLYLRSV